MKRVLFGLMRSTITVLCVAAAIAMSGCGDDDGTARTPPPSPTPVQAFTGNFAGTVTLDADRTGVVSLTVQANEQAAGTLTVSGGATTETVPLTGFVAVSNGNFSLSGRSTDASITATVSGTLPAPVGGAGFLTIQIGTSIFRGTINAA